MRASGQIVFTEKVVMPDIRGLQFEIERYDPRLEPSSEPPPSLAGPDLTSAEAIAEGAKYFNLYREGVQILIDLGVPPRQIAGPRDIETTATRPESDPAKETKVVTDDNGPPTHPAAPKKLAV